MGKTEALVKGNALEDAVRAIERAILANSPSYSESTFRIEGKKHLNVDGVHHEIDIFVSAKLADAYDAVFVFECKNWEEKVSKNDIIVFSEKIKAASAQRGFFVARSFTKDALAQAALDARMALLNATELDPVSVITPVGFHGIHLGATKADISLLSPNAKPGPHGKPIDLLTQTFVLDAKPTNLNEFVQLFVGRLREERSNKFPSGAVAEGIHTLTFEGEHVFKEGQATLDGKPIEKIHASGTVEVHISKAVVISAYEVATRGRYVTVHLAMPIGEVVASFVELGATPRPA